MHLTGFPLIPIAPPPLTAVIVTDTPVKPFAKTYARAITRHATTLRTPRVVGAYLPRRVAQNGFDGETSAELISVSE